MKRTKKTTAILKAIAKDLPKQEYQHFQRLSEKGSDLIQRNVLKDSEGNEILPHKVYSRKTVVKSQVNHDNRLKSAFDANGIEGVKKYIGQFVKPDMRNEFFKKLDIAFA